MVTINSSHIGKTCPFCQYPIKSDSEVVICSECQIPHHQECWQENGGCTTFGCGSDRSTARNGYGPDDNILVVDFDDEWEQFSNRYHSGSVIPRKISKSFYLFSILLGYLGMIVLSVTAFVNHHQPEIYYVFLVISFLLFLYVTIVGLVFLYKIWESIQNGYARTTPGKVVGFLFIPFFNFYWIFPAFWGFAQDFNKLILHRGLKITPISEGLFLSYPILILCSLLPIPVVSILVGITGFIVFLYIINTACDKINELSDLYEA